MIAYNTTEMQQQQMELEAQGRRVVQQEKLLTEIKEVVAKKERMIQKTKHELEVVRKDLTRVFNTDLQKQKKLMERTFAKHNEVEKRLKEEIINKENEIQRLKR